MVEEMAKLSLWTGSRGLNLILVTILLMLLLDALLNPRGLRDLAVLQHDRGQLELARDRLNAENARRAATIARLRADDTYLQRLIHQELGYVRGDELIYRFPDRSDSENDAGGQPQDAVK
jgi:cell division protein FtsB